MLRIDQTVQFSVGCILSSTVENEQRERADIQFTFDRATNTSQHTLQQLATTEHIRGNVVHYQARNGAQSEAMTARGGQSFSLCLLTQFPLQQVNQDGHQDMKIRFSFLS